MNKKILLILMILSVVVGLMACKKATEEKKTPKVGPVKINLHPSTLERKTVVLRWNGKFNGDNFLNRVAELLTQQMKGVKVIKMWEVDKTTAAISDSLEKSEEFIEKIVKLKPDIVIASQAD
jgi:ABC-type Fe3+-hydroxamate transport system substrate-binding protein